MINLIPSNKEFNDTVLAFFIKKIGFNLPKDYIVFLKKYNGGYVENSYSRYYKNGVQKFILTSMFGLGLESDIDLMNQFEIYKNRIPITCIPIARDAGGNLVCLNLSKDKYGYVYFWNHEEEKKMTIIDLDFIADSFNDFYNSVEIDELDASVAEGLEVKNVWVDSNFLKEIKNNSEE